jgi:hypothetical protein
MSLVKFIDSIGRTILGEQLSLSDTTLKVKNPVMVNIIQQADGQLQVQLIPLFFAEFIDPSSRSQGSTWSYNTNSIAIGEVVLDGKLEDQYNRIFNAPVVQVPKAGEQVIKLFDE